MPNLIRNAASYRILSKQLLVTPLRPVSTTRFLRPLSTMSNIPKEQKAMVIPKIGSMPELKTVPVRTPGPTEVLVNVKYSGVCHTDLHAVNGDWPVKPVMPLIGGHEGAGVVVAKGDQVHDIQLGDHVGIKWLAKTCYTCSFCQTADESLCPNATYSGYSVDGSFQQYAIADAMTCARIPKDLPLDQIAPILCAGLTVYKGLKESGARPGQYVAIVGAGGGLGSIALQYAKAMGLHTIAIDGGDEKGATCKQLGASTYIDFTKTEDIVSAVRAATPEGNGPHATLLLAVAEKPFEQACQYIRPHGTVVCIALPAEGKLKADIFNTVFHMVQIKGSLVGNRADTEEAIGFFSRGLIKAPIKIAGLSELPRVFDDMKEGKIVGRIVLDTSK